MPYVRPNKNQHVYVLGIDFGHGETSVDLCPIQWDDSYLKLKSPESIEIFNGVQAIKSVLLVEKKKGEKDCYYIGQQAVARFSNPRFHTDDVKFDFYSYFKKVPSLMSEKDRDVMRIYMQEVYRQIRRQRSELNDNNHLVYIACPSNSTIWTEKEINNYAEIALEAGLPLAEIDEANRGIIRESRAAFLKARSHPQCTSSVKEGLLLIDFGSSTVDLTYYSSRFTDKPIDDGENCGASRVEKDITNDLTEKYQEVSQAKLYSTSAQTAILMSVRDAKEKFYEGDYCEDMEVSMSLTKFTAGAVKKSVEYFYSDDEIKKMLEKYRIEIKKAFESFRDKYLIDNPIKLIFLTGGASRMNFIQEIARSVFNYEGDFFKEINPSLTISNGIALAGRADLRTFSMEGTLGDPINSADIANRTIEKAASTMADEVVKKTSICYISFASRDYDDNLYSLESEIKKSIDSIHASDYLTAAYNDVLKSVANSKVIPTINNIVKDYFPDFAIEEIKGYASFTCNIKSNSLNTISSVISNSLSEIEEDIIEGVAKFIWNTVVGIPVILAGGAINIAACAYNHVMGKKDKDVITDEMIDGVCFSFRDKTTKLSLSKRNDVKNEFEKNKSSYQNSICSDIKSKLLSDSSLIEQINNRGREEIKKYIHEQVQNARIMLN